jgi:hypothetical protein
MMADLKPNGANLGLIFLKYISDAFQAKTCAPISSSPIRPST